MFREEIIGRARLILGDCRDVLPTLGKVDAVVTDPPYGLAGKLEPGGAGKWALHKVGGHDWDQETSEIVLSLPSIADHSIIWGGNYYPLPPVRGWLLWDKIVREFSSGHAEMAWTTLDQPIRAFNFANGELASEGKVHPTQKPIRLMKWCLGFLPAAQSILDPFCGSGTTGVAALQLGRSFVGIERDPDYFEMARQRIAAAAGSAGPLFGEAA